MTTEELKGLIIPKHIAIILDGNRRYARENGLTSLKGHKKGAENVKNLLEWVEEIGIKELTLYTFSMNNFNRNKEEVNYLFKLVKEFFKQFLDSKQIKEKKVRIDFLGRISMFPEDIQQMVKEMKEKTKDNDQYKLNFCFGYGGRTEIVDACRNIAQQIKESKINLDEIDEDLVGKNMYFNNEPDLIIRTSGEKRISDFLLWQGNYSELFFIKKYWPAFSKEELIAIIKEFNQRDRRFGK